MGKTFQILVVIVSFLGGVMLMSQLNSCGGKDRAPKCPERNIVDSIRWSVHIDTIPFQAKGPIISHKGGSKFDSTLYKQCSALTLDSINISDTLIKGYVKTKVRNNQLDSLELVYTPLFPKYIRKDSTIFKTTTITETKYEPYSQNIFYLGGSVGTNDIGVHADLKTKKDLIYGYKFGMTYQGLKTHNIEFKIPIFKSKHKNK